MVTTNAIILTVPADFLRLQRLYYKLGQNLPVAQIYFIGNKEVGSLLQKSDLGEQFAFIDEESILSFDKVKDSFEEILGYIGVPRGLVGWYYQQFLKMSYANICEDSYYLAWDGDTVPVRTIEMFHGNKPYLDLKREYHRPYFKTIEKLFPQMHKMIEKSFISEHMLFRTDIMQRIITQIENADYLEGNTFYERILRSVGMTGLTSNSFSEFELYGTFVAFYHPEAYQLRNWTSYRNCGQYFSPDDISEDEMEWLAKDFYAITFEKGHTPEPGYEFFRDKKYQSKLSARQIVEIIQDESCEDDYRESWD